MKSDAGWAAAGAGLAWGAGLESCATGETVPAAARRLRVDDEAGGSERGTLEEVATADADVGIGVVSLSRARLTSWSVAQSLEGGNPRE